MGFLAAAAGYALLPRDGHLYGWWIETFSIAAVVATVVGLRLRNIDVGFAWTLIVAGMLTTLAADAAVNVDWLVGAEATFPSFADALYLAGDVVLIAGLLGLVRRQSGGFEATMLVDLAILGVAASVVAWAILIEPNNLSADATALQKATSLAYPTLDALTVAAAVRLSLGAQVPAALLVAGSFLLALVGRLVYGFASLRGWYATGNAIDLVFVSATVLWISAMLHPSLRELGTRVERTVDGGRGRLAVLVSAALLTPFIVVADVAEFDPLETIVFVSSFALLAALVTSRLLLAVVRHARLQAREQALRRASATLVAARTRDEIHRASVSAARELGTGDYDAAALGLVAAKTLEIVAAEGEGLEGVFASGRDSLAGNVHAQIQSTAGLSTIAVKDRSDRWLVSVISVQGEPLGALLVRSHRRIRRVETEGLETLAAQVGLALEAVARAEDMLERRAAERFRSLIQNSSDVILIVEPDLTIRFQTPSVQRVLGHRSDALVGTALTVHVHSEDRDVLLRCLEEVEAQPGIELQRELRLRRADGSWTWAECIVRSLLDDPNVRGYVLTARDVSEHKQLEAELAHQAFHDPLTGLANRALFMDRVGHALERDRRHPEALAVLFLDIDDFKTINDSLGHPAGDEVLRIAAERLAGCVRPADTCARFGGDEFALLIERIGERNQPQIIAGRLLDALAGPIQVQGTEVVIRASIGIATSGVGTTSEELLRNADLAMYRAKGRGKFRIELFEPDMHTSVLERLELKADLQRAAGAGELGLEFQPIVSLRTSSIVGLEALLRWQHPERGTLAPDSFVALAEETGLIVPLGRQVLHDACSYAHEWQQIYGRRLRMSVNISARQLQDAGFPDDVRAVLAKTGLAPDGLALELTESMLMADPEAAIARLGELRRLGVGIAIDDFGTGYSSLGYLRSFPVDTLKIAKAFVEDLDRPDHASKLAAAIVRLGSTLGLDTVAEGIETAAQRDRLWALRCPYGQGYLFSRPLAPDDVGRLLARHALESRSVA